MERIWTWSLNSNDGLETITIHALNTPGDLGVTTFGKCVVEIGVDLFRAVEREAWEGLEPFIKPKRRGKRNELGGSRGGPKTRHVRDAHASRRR
jgi:hypothetical protein